MPRASVGTSGWQYRHWRGAFYPEGVPRTRWFSYYTGLFSTVELNSSFYHLPKEESFRKWARVSPPGFLFAVKGNRFVTHLKKLKDVEESIDLFLQRAGLLGDKLGPILWQLPPSLGYDPERLQALLERRLPGQDWALEPRHPSWAQEACFEQLRAHGIAWCVGDTPQWDYTRALLDPGHVSPLKLPLSEVLARAEDVSPFLYVRLHGHVALYDTDYGEALLAAWARYVGRWLERGLKAYVYFDNDGHAYAPHNALRLRERLRGAWAAVG